MFTWNVRITLLVAILPAVFLMIMVYKSDHLEKESGRILRKLALGGVFATGAAIIEEKVFKMLLGCFYDAGELMYNIIMYFGIVAFSEETSKFIFLNMFTWNDDEFNCQYDGVVYAVFVSMGFALLENILYVFNYGITTGIVRALTAIPGHACFGIFMGIFYGIAKKYYNRGNGAAATFFKILGVVSAAILHGTYDFMATYESETGLGAFIAFVVILFAISFFTVRNAAKNDQYI